MIYSNHKSTPTTAIMRYTIFTLAAAASVASAQSSSSPASASPTGTLIPVGEKCDPNGTPCALGANCYAVNSMLQPVCGNFQASCKNDQQCAFNTCNLEQGLCNGFIASSSASSSSASATITTTPTAPGPMPAPSSTIVAPAGSLPLGAECNGGLDVTVRRNAFGSQADSAEVSCHPALCLSSHPAPCPFSHLA